MKLYICCWGKNNLDSAMENLCGKINIDGKCIAKKLDEAETDTNITIQSLNDPLMGVCRVNSIDIIDIEKVTTEELLEI